MNVLDLFSGIGGFSLGLGRAGMRTVAFCEIDPYCQAILRKHWPTVPVWRDVRILTAKVLADAGIMGRSRTKSENKRNNSAPCGKGSEQASWTTRSGGIDLICGGFPCQDISVAGQGAGIDGSRSGLWKEYARIIGEVRPRYVIVENVAALLGRGLERVFGDLAALGYDAEWHCIPASAIGAPHRRDRVWIVAYAAWHVRGEQAAGRAERQRTRQCSQSVDVAYADRPRPQGWLGEILSKRLAEWSAWPGCSSSVPDTEGDRRATEGQWPETGHADRIHQLRREPSARDWWQSEPDVGRVAHGVPFRVDRLRSLGNAIVPQIAEIIGRAIMEIEHET